MEPRVFQLENEAMCIAVSTKGAELRSLYSKVTQTEYLWQMGYETWPHHSMLLFPNPGRIAGDRTLIDGKVYPATMHGFANDMEFEVLQADGEHLLLQISDTEQTRKSFPYRFRLQVAFALEGALVKQTFRVINEDTRTVYFSLGAHPGFYCPIAIDETGEDYVLTFDSPQNINQMEMQKDTRLLTGKRTPRLTGERELFIGEHFFDDGPMIWENVQAKTVTMRSVRSGRFVQMGIEGFPYLCLWGVGGKMSILCIEPWCGVTDLADTDHVWERKLGIESVDVGDVFERTITFRVG